VKKDAAVCYPKKKKICLEKAVRIVVKNCDTRNVASKRDAIPGGVAIHYIYSSAVRRRQRGERESGNVKKDELNTGGWTGA
jgi:hypothetical protein